VEVIHRVVIGTQAKVDAVLAPCGWQISTAFIECLNLSLRQRVVAIRRRSTHYDLISTGEPWRIASDRQATAGESGPFWPHWHRNLRSRK
jgi:hypothetical protein